MVNLESILQELRQERDRIEQAITAIEGLIPESGRMSRHTSPVGRKPKRKMSAAGRARIAAAARARWAKWRVGKKK